MQQSEQIPFSQEDWKQLPEAGLEPSAADHWNLWKDLYNKEFINCYIKG